MPRVPQRFDRVQMVRPPAVPLPCARERDSEHCASTNEAVDQTWFAFHRTPIDGSLRRFPAFPATLRSLPDSATRGGIAAAAGWPLPDEMALVMSPRLLSESYDVSRHKNSALGEVRLHFHTLRLPAANNPFGGCYVAACTGCCKAMDGFAPAPGSTQWPSPDIVRRESRPRDHLCVCTATHAPCPTRSMPVRRPGENRDGSLKVNNRIFLQNCFAFNHLFAGPYVMLICHDVPSFGGKNCLPASRLKPDHKASGKDPDHAVLKVWNRSSQRPSMFSIE